jgi:hypothetical protein
MKAIEQNEWATTPSAWVVIVDWHQVAAAATMRPCRRERR